ncbi:MAG: hypothetical protein V4527_18220 [Pseudomonadota bacterium]
MKLIGLILAAIVIIGLLFVLWAVLVVGKRADEMQDEVGDVVKVPRR